MQGILGSTKKKIDEDAHSSDAYESATSYAASMKPDTSSIPAPTVSNNNTKQYDVNTDYTAKMNEAIASGNYGAAAEYERLHNEKNGDLGLGYANSGIFNYIDERGLGGLKEAKRQEISDYINQGFSYNYEDDPEYQAMRSLKEKEADKAYKDGYAQMSAAFDGDIPVNMINKLLTTQSEIVDQADSYIPQLRQAAYNMYLDKGNNLYKEYGLLSDEESSDYNRWISDRDMFIEGNENAYDRAWNEDDRDYSRERDTISDERYTDETEWERDYKIDERDYNRERDEEEFNYKKSYDDWYKDFTEEEADRDEKYRWAALYI